MPAKGVSPQQLADAAQLASLADETPEGRSIVVLAKQKFGIRERDVATLGATFIQFSAQTRMSGVNLEGRQIRKGAEDSIRSYVAEQGGHFPDDIQSIVVDIARRGSTPLVVADGPNTLGVIERKTSSKAVSRNASRNCGRWASKPS